jgi:hypothetical protein
MTITIMSNPPMIELRLSDAPVASEASGDVIADLNTRGNWIRGLEILGSTQQFSLEKALACLSPEPSVVNIQQPVSELTVTYDKNADAGFLYLPYTDAVRRASRRDPSLLKVSYSIEDESALFGLDKNSVLVFVRFKLPSSQNLSSFVEIFGSQS